MRLLLMVVVAGDRDGGGIVAHTLLISFRYVHITAYAVEGVGRRIAKRRAGTAPVTARLHPKYLGAMSSSLLFHLFLLPSCLPMVR